MANSNKFGRKPADIVLTDETWFRPDLLGIARPARDAFSNVANGRFAETDPYYVNTITSQSQDDLTITALASGGFVAIWMTGFNVKAQLFDRHGAKLGGEFTAAAGTTADPNVVGLASGGFVVAWTDFEGGVNGIWANRFDAAGNPLGGQFLISDDASGRPSQPSFAALSSGGFVATWTAQDQPSTSQGIKGQIFDAQGVKVGGEFLVNTIANQEQYYPTARGLPGGGFVVAWTDASVNNSDDTVPTAVRAQIFDAAGAKAGGEFLVNSRPGEQFFQSITVLASGNFVIGWSERTGPVDVRGQIFSPTGAKIGAEFRISTSVANNHEHISLAALPDGGFLASWRAATGIGNYGDDGEILAQLFDASGAKVGGEFMVNVGTVGGQSLPQAVSFGSGDFVIGWLEFMSQADDFKARTYFSVTAGTNNADNFAGTGDRDFYQGLGGADRIAGGAANDSLGGGAGADVLDGGAGSDTFVFASPGDSSLSALRSDGRKFLPDRIEDFTSGVDKIDLSAVDAIGGTAPNDAFTFIGQSAFGHAGELRFEVRGGLVYIHGDVDGNGFADFEIIARTTTLVASDFIL